MSSRSYNYSSLVSAYSCQQLYKYQYIDKVKPLDSTLSGDMAFGSAIHFALENYYQDGDDLVNSFNIYWEAEKSKPLKFGRYNHEALSDMGTVLLERFKRLHVDKIKPIKIETRLYGTLNGNNIEGTPDIIGEFEGKPSVIDFKTSGSRYHKDKARLSEQMALYNYLSDSTDIKQFVYIVFIKGSAPTIQIVKHQPTEKELYTLMANIHNQIKELEAKTKVDLPTYSRNTSNCIKGEIICPYFKNCWKQGE